MQATKDDILYFLHEDDAFNDVTTHLTCENKIVNFQIISREGGIYCGANVLDLALKCFDDSRCELEIISTDGSALTPGYVITNGVASIFAILSVERTVLNIVQRLCGIATLTNKFIHILDNERIQILDTRKTTPGLRKFEKYAVTVGGGHNHRMSLSDRILIKDNHIALNDIVNVVQKAIIGNKNHLKIEVECDTLDQVLKIANLKVDIIMLDNMSVGEIAEAAKIIRKNPAIKIEVSGGVDLENIASYRNLDIDFISVGGLTHSARSLDLSLEIFY